MQTKTNVKAVTVDILCWNKNVKFPRSINNTKSRTVSPIMVIKNVFNALIDFICQTINAKMLMCSVKHTILLQDNVQDAIQPLSSIMVNVQNDLSPILFTTRFKFCLMFFEKISY